LRQSEAAESPYRGVEVQVYVQASQHLDIQALKCSRSDDAERGGGIALSIVRAPLKNPQTCVNFWAKKSIKE